MSGIRRVAAIAAALALGVGVAACGSDDEDSGSGDETTTEEVSAEEITVTTGDEEGGGYSWEVEPSPTEETTSVKFVNDSEVEHAIVFAQLNEGFTLEEAYELEGRKGSITSYVEGGAKPGDTQTFEVEEPVKAGNYVLLCPIPGHYQQGQLEEGEIS